MKMGGKHLTREQRFLIEKELGEKTSVPEIARKLGVNPSTIYREIKRNTAKDFNDLYCYSVAQKVAESRRSKASKGKKFNKLTSEVISYIYDRLKVHTSPDVIAGEMRHRWGIQVSKNTIYRHIQENRKNGGSLYRLLPHWGKPYNHRSGKAIKVKIPGRIGIEQRPEIADQKCELGHFEADTIFGIHQKSFLLTLVDKANKITIIRKLADKRAETVAAAFLNIVNNTMYEFKTITSDNGSEFALHVLIIPGSEDLMNILMV